MATPVIAKQWLLLLRRFATAQLTTASHRDNKSGFSLEPVILHIDVRFPKHSTQVPKLRQALILLSLASRIDVSVWANIRLKTPYDVEEFRQPTQFVDPQMFREEDLTPAFEMVFHSYYYCVAFEPWLEKLKMLFDDANDNAAFHRAKERLRLANQWSNPSDPSQQQVLVSLRVDFVGSNPPIEALVSTLEAISSLRSARAPVLRVSHLAISVRQLTEAFTTAIVRIQALGIAVRAVDVEDAGVLDHFDQNLSVLCNSNTVVGEAVGQRPSLEKLTLGYDAYDMIAGSLAKALLMRDQAPMSVEVVTHRSDYVDWRLVCRVLSVASTKTKVPSFQIAMQNMTPPRVRALQRAMDVVRASPLCTRVRVNVETRAGRKLLRAIAVKNVGVSTILSAMIGAKNTLIILPNGKIVGVPRESVVVVTTQPADSEPANEVATNSQLANVRMIVGLCVPEGIPTLVAFLGLCFPAHLVALDVEVAMGASVSATDIATILAMFPQLQCLKLRPTELTRMDVFLDTYRSGRCQLRTISIDSGHIGFIPFFDEMASPSSPVVYTLKELKIGFAEDSVENSTAYLGAITAMLSRNQLLEFLELVITKACILPVTDIAAALEPFHRTPLPKVSVVPIPLRAKFAFLGSMAVLQRDDRTSESPWRERLDRGVLELILSFARPCLERIVHVRYEKMRGTRIANTGGRGTLYTSEVDDELVSLQK